MIYILFFVLCIFYSCNSQNNSIIFSTKKAKSNRNESEKIIKHYESDEQKLAAAKFLIQHMAFHYNKNNSNEVNLQGLYDKHAAISEKYNWMKTPLPWRQEIDSLEKAYAHQIAAFSFLDYKSDIETIKSEWLIKQIDLAFEAWQNNIYTREYPFEMFCEFILPYRFKEGIILEDSKEMFYKRHHTIFKDSVGTSFIQRIDSILDFQRFDLTDWEINF